MPNGQNNPVPQDEWSQYAVKDAPKEDEWSQYAVTPDKKKVVTTPVAKPSFPASSPQLNPQSPPLNQPTENTNDNGAAIQTPPKTISMEEYFSKNPTVVVPKESALSPIQLKTVQDQQNDIRNIGADIAKTTPERTDPNIQQALVKLQINPKDDAAIYQLGYGNLGKDNTAAEKLFNDALDINPNNYKAKIGLADLAFVNKDYDAALKYRQDAMALIPKTVILADGKEYNNPDYTNNQLGIAQAQVLVSKNNPQALDETDKSVDAILANDPKNVLALQTKAEIARQQGRTQDAKNLTWDAVTANSENTPAPTMYELEQKWKREHPDADVQGFVNQWLQSHADFANTVALNMGGSQGMGEFVANLVDPVGYVMGNGVAVKDGLQKMGEGIQQMADNTSVGVIPTIKDGKQYFTGLTKTIMGGTQATFATLMTTPTGYAFTQALHGIDALSNDEASKIIMSPIATMFPVQNELGQNLEGIGDLALNILALAALHKGIAGDTKGAKEIKDAASKLKGGETLTKDETQLLTETVHQNLTPETLEEIYTAAQKIPNGTSEKVTAEVVPLIIEKKTLQEENQQLQQEKSTLDPNFHEQKDNEIKANEEKLSAADDEIKFILDSSNKTEPIDLPIDNKVEGDFVSVEDFNKLGYKLPSGLEDRGVSEIKSLGDDKFDVKLENGTVLKDVLIHKFLGDESKVDNKSLLTPSDKMQIAYNGKMQETDLEFKQAAQKVRVNLKTGENGYVKTPDGKTYEISTSNNSAKLVETPKSSLPIEGDKVVSEGGKIKNASKYAYEQDGKDFIDLESADGDVKVGDKVSYTRVGENEVRKGTVSESGEIVSENPTTTKEGDKVVEETQQPKTEQNVSNTISNTEERPAAESSPNPQKTDSGAGQEVKAKEKTKLQLAKEARIAAKAKLDSIYNKQGIIDNPEEKARALFDYHKALVKEAKEHINERIKTIQEFADKIGEKVDDFLQRAWDEAKGLIKPIEDYKEFLNEEAPKASEEPFTIAPDEKSTLKRLVNADNISDRAKAKLEAEGLKYTPHSHDEARELATEIVKGVGENEAVAYAESGRFSGDVNSSIFAVSIDRLADRESALRAKGKGKEADALADKWADFAIRYDKAGRDGGRFTSQIYDWYKKSKLGIKLKQQKLRDEAFSDWLKKREGNFKDFWDEVKNEPIVKDAIDKAAEEKVSGTEKAKKLANKIRKAKLDKDIVLSSIPFAKEVINGAIEAVAKVIEAKGKIEDAIQAGIDYMKDTDWYKNLQAYKNEAETKLSDYLNKLHEKSSGDELTPEERRINSLEKSIEAYDAKIAELQSGKEVEAATAKKNESDKVEELKKQRDEKRKEYQQLRKQKAGITKEVENKIVERWSKKLKNLPDAQKQKFIRNLISAVVEKGDLTYEDFKNVLAESIGLGKLTEKEGKLIDDYVDATNQVTELGTKAQEAGGTKESLDAYDAAVKKAERLATDMGAQLNTEVNLTNRFTSFIALNTLGFGTLLHNIGWNIAQQAWVRFPVSLIGTATDYTAYAISLAANKVYGTPILKPETNTWLAQRGYFSGLAHGTKQALGQIKRGGTLKDYFSDSAHQPQIKPLQSLRELKAWNFGKGDKYLSGKEVIDKAAQIYPGMFAEMIKRGLYLGDSPPRLAAEGAKAEQIAKLKFGITDRNQIELLKRFPVEQAKKYFLEQGMSEEKAQSKAEDIKAQLNEAGDDATLTMDNLASDLAAYLKKFKQGEDSVAWNGIRNIGKVIGVINIPYLRIPANAAWLAMNLRNPLLSLAQSAAYAIHAAKTGDARSWRMSRKWMAIAATGVAANTVAAWMASNNIITPRKSDEDSKKEGGLTTEFGKQFSMNINNLLRGGGETKDGDINIDLSWYGAQGALLNTAAQQRNKEIEDGEMDWMNKAWFNLSQGGIEGFTSNVMGTTNSLINAYTMGGGYVNQLGLQYLNLIGNITEPAVVAQMSKYGFGRQLDIKGDTFGDALSKDIYQRTFGVVGEKPETKLGVFGAPQTVNGNYFGRMLNGTLGIEIADTEKFGYPIYDMYNKTHNSNFAPPTIPTSIDVNGKPKELTYVQQRELKAIIGNTRIDMIGAFLNNKASLRINGENKYMKDLTQDQVAYILKTMYDNGGELGMEKFKIRHPEFVSTTTIEEQTFSPKPNNP